MSLVHQITDLPRSVHLAATPPSRMHQRPVEAQRAEPAKKNAAAYKLHCAFLPALGTVPGDAAFVHVAEVRWEVVGLRFVLMVCVAANASEFLVLRPTNEC